MSLYAHFFRQRKRSRLFGGSLRLRSGHQLFVRLPSADCAAPHRPAEPAQVQNTVQRTDYGKRRARRISAGRGHRILRNLSILVFTLFTHPIGRIAGPSWLVLGLVAYFIYRRRRNLPLLGSQKRDWRKQQADILRDAGELELMDEYLANVKASDARKAAALPQ